MEPKYPGAYESVVYLNDCWDENLLEQNKRTIAQLFVKNKALHERGCRFIAAAASLTYDTYKIACDCTDVEKLERFIRRLCLRSLKSAEASKESGQESVRFLSAVTAQGVTTFHRTVDLLCDTVYVIDDEYGAASRQILSAIRSDALAKRQDIITCYCPLFPYEKIEHIFIPALRLGFVTSNRYHTFENPDYKVIHSKRFYKADKLRLKKQRISFNRKAIVELIGEASRLNAEAYANHTELESYYIPAMDFDKVSQKVQQTLSLLQKRLQL